MVGGECGGRLWVVVGEGSRDSEMSTVEYKGSIGKREDVEEESKGGGGVEEGRVRVE